MFRFSKDRYGLGGGVGRGLGVGANLGVGVGLGVGVAVAVPVAMGVAVAVGVAVTVTVAVGVGVGLVAPQGVALDTGVGETLGVGPGYLRPLQYRFDPSHRRCWAVSGLPEGIEPNRFRQPSYPRRRDLPRSGAASWEWLTITAPWRLQYAAWPWTCRWQTYMHYRRC